MTLDEILGTLDALEPWQRRAMCAAAVERVAPVFRRFGRPASQPTFATALDAVWLAVASGRAPAVASALQRLPETAADDSHSREYYAHRTLHILRCALECIADGGSRSAGRCLEEVASLCDDIDTLLTSAPGQTYRHDPDHPAPPGDVETLELRALTEVLASIRDAISERAAAEPLRMRSRQLASIYDAAAAQLTLS